MPLKKPHKATCQREILTYLELNKQWITISDIAEALAYKREYIKPILRSMFDMNLLNRQFVGKFVVYKHKEEKAEKKQGHTGVSKCQQCGQYNDYSYVLKDHVVKGIICSKCACIYTVCPEYVPSKYKIHQSKKVTENEILKMTTDRGKDIESIARILNLTYYYTGYVLKDMFWARKIHRERIGGRWHYMRKA